jgi:hypothetical protein
VDRGASFTTSRFIGVRDAKEEILMKTLFWVFCVASVANGLWMLAAPYSWYWDLPASVPDTGPFNPHFVRDIGVTFVVLGAGFGWCATNLDRCYPVHLGLTGWFVGHAALHAADILTGRLPHAHWGIDAPAVFLPAVLLLALSLPPVWRAVLKREGSVAQPPARARPVG